MYILKIAMPWSKQHIASVDSWHYNAKVRDSMKMSGAWLDQFDRVHDGDKRAKAMAMVYWARLSIQPSPALRINRRWWAAYLERRKRMTMRTSGGRICWPLNDEHPLYPRPEKWGHG